MNLRRGFRRVAIALAVVVAVICAGLSASTVNEKHHWAQEHLRMEQGRLQREQERYRRNIEAKQRPQQEEKVVPPFREPYRPYSFEPKVKTEAELRQMEARLKELEKGFWVTLTVWAFVGLCILAGLGSAAAGCLGVWLFYVLIRWVVWGFYD